MSEATAALDAYARLDLAGWTGLPDGTTLADAAAALGVDPQRFGRWFLGDPPREAFYTPAELGGFAGQVRVWFRGDRLLQVSGELPALDATAVAALLAAWGEPDLRRDYSVDVMRVAGGEHVYASRGLAARLTPAGDRMLALAVFVPTTPAGYVAELAADEERTERPLGG